MQPTEKYKENFKLNIEQLFAEGEAIIRENSPRRSRGEYSPIIIEPEANNCFSIFTQVFCVFWD